MVCPTISFKLPSVFQKMITFPLSPTQIFSLDKTTLTWRAILHCIKSKYALLAQNGNQVAVSFESKLANSMGATVRKPFYFFRIVGHNLSSRLPSHSRKN